MNEVCAHWMPSSFGVYTSLYHLVSLYNLFKIQSNLGDSGLCLAGTSNELVHFKHFVTPVTSTCEHRARAVARLIQQPF
ncbi:protein of unknown function [Paraburkholderia dioscoreae]|uniref:Uncharacterized protein n=1 Tax=Paraburkholderia dioscoreae TaxID=2604047 RepID=A0A5Q4Z3J0_9BURK|nr:protein of unknown function [Paraburkholderia dioscoreae]